MIKRFLARRQLAAALAHHDAVTQERDSALQSGAPERVLDAYDTALANAENRWANAVRALALVS